MIMPRLRTAVLAAAASLTLGACAYDGYGYGGMSVGYGGGYYDPYYDDYGYGYGYGHGYGYPSYYGWYGGYYYPGTGFYIYDRWGKRHRWGDRHRHYWENRRRHWRGDRDGKPRWDGYRSDQRRTYQRPPSNYSRPDRPDRPNRQVRERVVRERAVDRPRVQRERPRIDRESRRATRIERRSRRD